MTALIEALKGTPWWVYALFVFLVYIGIKALKPHTLSIRKLLILPAVFLVWSIFSLITDFQGAGDVMLWLFFIIIGSTLGWALFKSVKIQGDKNKMLIGLPGSPFILILILFIFGIKYYFGYYLSNHPEAHQNTLFHSASVVTSALITGIFIGRVFILLKKFYHAHHTKLKEK